MPCNPSTIDRGTFAAHGLRFEWRTEYDENSDPPWKTEDGHGPVREVPRVRYGRPAKRPGEWLMHNRGHDAWAYDAQAAMREALRDAWGLGPDELAALRARLGREPTRREVCAQAVRNDFDHLRGYLDESWCYVGVCVRLLGPDDEPVTGKFNHALWGIESNAGDYLREVAHDLAHEIAHERGALPEQRRAAWRAALTEARERRYWAARDTATVGA